MLGNSEDNTALSRALSQLAELEDKMEQLHQEQAASDFFIFEQLLADYIRLLGAVRVSAQLQRRPGPKSDICGSQQGSACRGQRVALVHQGCFDQRIRAWQRWQEAQSTLQKKREAEAKLLWANKPDKLQQAKEEISEVRPDSGFVLGICRSRWLFGSESCLWSPVGVQGHSV